MPRHAGTVIVGGGAIGVSIARELALRGVDVLLLERNRDLSSGASAGTAGLICPSHAETIASPQALRDGIRWMFDATGPFALRPDPKLAPWLARFTASAITPGRAARSTAILRDLSARALALHVALAETVPTGLVQRGILNVYASEHDLEHGLAHAAEQRASGLAIDALDADAVRELEPTVRSGIFGGTLARDEAHLDSDQYTRAVADAARAAAAQIITGVDVIAAAESPSGIELTTTVGPLSAERLVLAGGAWSARLAADLGIHLPLAAAKGYHVEVEGSVPPSRPVYLHGTRVVATPLPGRLRFAGTLELGSDPEVVDRRRAESALAAGRAALTGLDDARVTSIWRGLRPCLPDGLPAIGRTRASDRVLVATGHQMLGITLAPITAEVIGRLVAGEEPGVDLGALTPDRFRSVRQLVGRR